MPARPHREIGPWEVGAPGAKTAAEDTRITETMRSRHREIMEEVLVTVLLESPPQAQAWHRAQEQS